MTESRNAFCRNLLRRLGAFPMSSECRDTKRSNRTRSWCMGFRLTPSCRKIQEQGLVQPQSGTSVVPDGHPCYGELLLMAKAAINTSGVRLSAISTGADFSGPVRTPCTYSDCSRHYLVVGHLEVIHVHPPGRALRPAVQEVLELHVPGRIGEGR